MSCRRPTSAPCRPCVLGTPEPDGLRGTVVTPALTRALTGFRAWSPDREDCTGAKSQDGQKAHHESGPLANAGSQARRLSSGVRLLLCEVTESSAVVRSNA